jgi:site-specific DNA recombinase
MKQPLPKAVSYTRVSSKEQEKEGFSIPAQLKLLKNYAADKRINIIQDFTDVETAKSSGRMEFNRMVDFLKSELNQKENQSPCRILLVEKTDRLYRNIKDWVTIDPETIGIEIHFVKENNILSKDSRSQDKFMHGIRVVMAKNYIDNLSEETKKGMLEKAEQGIYPSQAPIGYINVQCGNKKIIQPDPNIEPIIKQLYERYATGNYSLLQLQKSAHRDGLTYRKSGSPIPKSVIHKILKNPIYYGDFLWKKKLYRGTQEPIITKELYDRVQGVMVKKGKRRTRQQKHTWAFQGMLSCGHCGCALTAEIQKGIYTYYHCTGNKGKCPEKKYVREEEVARQFGEALSLIRMEKNILSWVTKALKESHKDEKEFHDEAVSRLQKKYKKSQSRIDLMYEDKLDGVITAGFFERKSTQYRGEQENILRAIEKHQSANQAYIADGIKILELAQSAGRLYHQQSMAEKRRLLQFVYSNSIWKDGRLHPRFRKPFDIIADTNLAYNKKKINSSMKNDLFSVWLPSTDLNRGPIG